MIYIYLRATEDWDVATNEDVVFWVPNKHSNVPYFDRAFNLPWIEYRRRLKQICQNAWSRLGLPVVNPGKWRHTQVIETLQDDDWLVPTDDDDWFHPLLPDYLEQHIHSCDFLRWDSLVFQSDKFWGFHPFKQFHKCVCSNSYAVRVGFLKNVPPGDQFHILCDHVASEPTAKKHRARLCVDLDKILSLYQWHPGSMSVLNGHRDYLTINQLVPSGPALELSQQQHWLQPEYGQVVKLVQSLQKPPRNRQHLLQL